MSYVRIGVAGPVGSGKTALIEALTRRMADSYSMGVVTNDIYTKEDAEFLAKHSVLPLDRIIGVVMVCGGYWCLWEEIGTRGERGRLETDFQLPSPGEKVAAYVFALSADGSSASDSVCVLPPTVWEKGE